MVQNLQDPRLIEVLENLKKLNVRFPVAEIAKRTGIGKGNISSVLTGKKPMSDNFYRSVKEKFPLDNQKETKSEDSDSISALKSIADSNKVLAESNKLIAESSKMLTESNLKLVEANAELAKKVQGQTSTENDVLGIPEALIPRFVSVLGLIAKAGTRGWKSEQEALAELSRTFYADLKKEKKVGTLERVGK